MMSSFGSMVDEECEAALLELKSAKETGDFDPDTDPNLLHQLLSDPRMDYDHMVHSLIIGLFLAGGETVIP